MTHDLTQDWPAPERPRPIVICGAGGIVRDAHLPAYAMAGLTVAGVTDIDRDRAEALAREHHIAAVHASLKEAGEAHGTDVVYDIAVPPHVLPGLLPELPDGAAVLMQKPMGADQAQAREIRQVCRDKGLTAAVNFQLRFSPMMRAVQDAVRRGLLGELLEIEVHLNIFTPWHLFPFLIPMKRVEIAVHSIHYLDAIRAVAGDPRGVFARSLHDPRADDFAQTRTSVILDYGPSLRGLMSINHNHRNGRKFQSAWFRFEGTEGAMMVKLGVCYDYPNGEADELWLCRNGGEWEQVPLTGSWFIESFMGPMRNVQRVASGEDTHLHSGVEDAYRTMALVEACFRSMERPAEPLTLD
ncbi:Gfo/Idh/MocA family protein [Histidinibacterium lentulum]|uniref:Gfo/Idh/MocA family oxidoreductase n=1 Tax=Histidinibacterium lentulum TaxID=2480588 RepID=A0A3N2QLL9_9RHOB|nr:Gfo/Idh/MocA family oxidoreductase [Histidinibacterium lentulum]ROT96088.1 gfo/Idh/MocA family oxidoreductase [Histidinibacterium lentulum]